MQLTFAAQAEPRHRRIRHELCQGERSAGDVVECLSLSEPDDSKHLRLLREADLVASRVDKQHRRYRLRPGPLAEIDTWPAPYHRFWAGRLDALQAHLDQEQV
jgi:DNA-binding transcriptional ArsR family regulator